jgi:tetratricopeptide (TPR) repeat protein
MSEESSLRSQQRRRVVLAGLTVMLVLLTSIGLVPFDRGASAAVEGQEYAQAWEKEQPASAGISIDYPEDGSIFPPGITPPTFIWRDAAATSWRINISFANKAPALQFRTNGERMHVGAIDPECVAESNKPPKLTPQQAASWTWTPDPATWSAIQLHSTGQPATVTITGYLNDQIVSAPSHSAFSTSRDPVGAPIFYRDVPLMPTVGTNGIVQPIPTSAIHLIKWRLRDIRQTESHTVLHNMPTCANCHSFSGDGKTMGIDIDGPANDKGLYAIVPIQREISIKNKDIVQWNTDGKVGQTRVGFMSQVSPDGRFVVSTFAGPSLDVPSTYYVTNFKDYRFLQVFYPTRGILEWYNRATGKRQPLPGADDPNYVQTDGFWSPDGKTIVFARAVARDPRQEGQKPALYANDPNETQIQYDLYRIPFNNGKGGTPERIVGASQNGMSNTFPKVSPDGRWIVFVQCHNGQLMRPDSQLYIVPFNGGVARRLRANTPTMNSWHSFSPNGRWLVFSSKARSPYTQMYLTHLDANGNSSPAILIDNATAANRAVNIPEFVNIAGDGIRDIQVPAVEVYKLIDQAVKLENQGDYKQALTIWRKALELDPDDAKSHNDLGMNLYLLDSKDEAFRQLRESIRINPMLVEGHYNLGRLLLQEGHPDQAVPELERTLTLSPRFSSAQEALSAAFVALGKPREALGMWHQVLTLQPNSVAALVGAARILATTTDDKFRNGAEAVTLSSRANDLTSGTNPSVLDVLAEAYAEVGQFSQALTFANRALDLTVAKGDDATAAAIRSRIQLYTANTPYRN